MAAATNYHRIDGFKQHRFIILQSWKADVQNELHGTNMTGLPGLVPSGSAEGEAVPLPFPASGGGPRSLDCPASHRLPPTP